MNVRELIEQLQLHPQDMRVIVIGYEGGYSDIGKVSEMGIKIDEYKGESFFGPHEQCDQEDVPNETALYIERLPNK